MFNINDSNITIIEKVDDHRIIYEYNGKRYYHKPVAKDGQNNWYNELIAEKIANRLNIPCCHYIQSEYNGRIGVSSEMFDTTNFIPIGQLLYKIYPREFREKKNNLEDIWNALEITYGKEVTERLMDELINIYLFDLLIGNPDRNTDNYGIINEPNNIRWNPLFDNEFMLSSIAIYNGESGILISPEDYRTWQDYLNCVEKDNQHEKFFNISDSMYKDRLKRMLPVISENSIYEIFEELKNEGVEIPDNIKLDLIEKFELNRKNINEVLLKEKVI